MTLIWALSAGFLTLAGVQADSDGRIAAIRVVGNRNINVTSIMAASGLKVGDPLTVSSLADAKRRVLATGLFGMHERDPSDGVRVTEGPDRGEVLFTVDENDLVKTITITGPGPLKPADILNRITTKPGNVLNLTTLQRDVSAVRAIYEERGYCAFVSDDLGTKNGKLTIPVVVGTIGRIQILGVPPRETKHLEREIRRSVGEYLHAGRFRATLKRLRLELTEDLGAPDSHYFRAGSSALVLRQIPMTPAANAESPPVISRIEIKGPQWLNHEGTRNAAGIRIGDHLDPDLVNRVKQSLLPTNQFDYSSNSDDQVSVKTIVRGRTATVIIEIREPNIREIRFKGSDPLPESSIRRLIKTKVGEAPNAPVIKEDVASIALAYARLGLVAAVVPSIAGSKAGSLEVVLTHSITVARVGSVRIGAVMNPQLTGILHSLRTQAGRYYRQSDTLSDTLDLRRLGIPVGDEPRIVSRSFGFVDVEWPNFHDLDQPLQVVRPLVERLSSDELKVFELVLNDLTKRFATKPTSHILLDTRGLGFYLAKDARVVMGDLGSVEEAFIAASQSVNFLFETQFTNWLTALQKVYPSCSSYLQLSSPQVHGTDLATVSFKLGPPGNHGEHVGEYRLIKRRGCWRIEDRGFPAW